MIVRTHLLIANETLGGPELRRLIEDRLAAWTCHFHVVVPAARREGVMKRVIDAYAGGRDDQEVTDDRAAAEVRLAAELDRLRSLGAEAEGAVGDVDPVVAALEALGDRTYDEIVLSTLPAGASQWVRMDLPHRLERALGRPITHVEGPAAT